MTKILEDFNCPSTHFYLATEGNYLALHGLKDPERTGSPRASETMKDPKRSKSHDTISEPDHT